MGSLYTAISGLQASSRWLDVISNNVSNSNTVGFKYSRVNFQDLVSQGLISASGPSTSANLGGINPSQLGVGVTVSSVQNILTQGTLQTTGNPTDVAISGSGYFTVKQGASTVYTRAGNFTFDNAGNLVTSGGGLVQGWSQTITRTATAAPVLQSITTSLTASGQPGNITIPQNLVMGPMQTSTQLSQAIHDQGVQLKGNLDSMTPLNPNIPGAGTAAALPPAYVPDATITSTVYDSLGTAHTITFLWTQTAITSSPTFAQATWNVKIFDTTGGLAPDSTAVTGNLLGDANNITFNADGSLQSVGTAGTVLGSVAGSSVVVAANSNWTINDAQKPANAIGLTPLPFTFTVDIGVDNVAATGTLGDRSGLTGEFGNGTTNGSGVYTPVQSAYTSFVDGNIEGTLVGISVDQTGTVNCQFSNNQIVKMAQLALTQFSNPSGLSKVGSSDFMQTANSGFPQTGTAGSNGFGVVQGGALEQSNVDLSIELTNMLVAQKMFESNARVITTADKILDTLVNLGR